MQRREYLVATGTVASTIAAGSPKLSGSARAQADDAEPIATAGRFELIEFAAPDRVEVMRPFEWSYSVRNAGDDDATFWTYFVMDSPDESGVVERRHATAVPADETSTVSANTAHSPYLGTLRLHLEAFDASVVVEAIPATMGIGEHWRSTEDVTFAVTDVAFGESYEYEQFDGTVAREFAGEGTQWAFVWLSARNDASERRQLPLATDVSLVADDQQFDRAFVRREEGAYESTALEPGFVRSGWIAYEIPGSLVPTDVVVSYRDEDVDGEWNARWHPRSDDSDSDVDSDSDG